MPFKSKAQMRAAFAGYLGKKMKKKAKKWAEETPNIKSLPEHRRAKAEATRQRAYKMLGGRHGRG